MSTASACEIAVVGGGVIGLACAEALSRDGHRVVVIERDALGRACSWAGGGMLTPLPPDQCPEAIRELLAESLALYPQWCERLHAESGIDPEFWRCGARYFKDAQPLDYSQLAQVRNPRLLKALIATLRARGVRLLEHTQALQWRSEHGRLRGALTSAGDIACEQAVLAAGAWSAGLGADGIAPIKGQMLLFKAPVGQLSQLLISDEVYLIPRRDGHIVVGSTVEDTGFDAGLTDEAREHLRARAEALWPPLRELPLLQHWAGLRPRPQGEAPLIGAHPDIDGVLLATGHFRIGITLAPATAQRIVQMIDRAAVRASSRAVG